jgi:hypothetical protein
MEVVKYFYISLPKSFWYWLDTKKFILSNFSMHISSGLKNVVKNNIPRGENHYNWIEKCCSKIHPQTELPHPYFQLDQNHHVG